MIIDWELVLKIAIPLGTLIIGRYLDLWFARKPKIISYLGHVSAFILNDQNRTQVYTHAVVVRNTGKAAANNVRVGHNTLPNYQLSPSIPHNVVAIPTGGTEIVFEKLVPGEQVTISYLYFPPLLWSQINSYTKSDEGYAKIITVIPTPQPSKVVTYTLAVLILVGLLTLIYLGVSFAIYWFTN